MAGRQSAGRHCRLFPESSDQARRAVAAEETGAGAFRGSGGEVKQRVRTVARAGGGT